MVPKEINFFFTANGPVSRVNMHPTEWEEIDVSYTSDRGLISRMSYINTQQKPVSERQQTGNKNKHSSQKKRNINSQTCSMSLVIREMEMKTALIFHLTPTI